MIRGFSIAVLVHTLWRELVLKALEFQWTGPGLLSTENVSAITQQTYAIFLQELYRNIDITITADFLNVAGFILKR